MDTMRLIVTSLLFCSCLAILFACTLALRKRSVSGASADFLALCGLCVAIYDFGYAMEINASSLTDVLFWVRFQHFGIQPMPVIWLLFSLRIMRKKNSLTPLEGVLLCVPPLVMLVCSQTLGGLNLLHPNPRLADGDFLSLFRYDRGWSMYLVTGIQSVYLAASTLLFTVGLIRGVPTPRKQAAIYWVGSLLPWASSLAYILGLTPNNLDTTPLVLSVSVVLFAVGFLRIGLLDIAPLARDVIFEGTPDGELVIDHRGRITDSNSRMRSILPGLEEAAIGVPARTALAGYSPLVDMLDREPPGEIEFQPDGRSDDKPDPRIFHVTSASLNNRSGKDLGMLMTFHDVTEMKELQLRLEYMAIHDELTGLYNRRYLNEFASREVERVKRYGGEFSVIMMDLDFFKRVNDTFGHMVGDRVLVSVAETCRKMLRKCDIIGRFGGEEILILLPETSADASRGVAEKLRAAIETQRVPYEGESIGVTASFGVADMNAERATFKDLLISADRALYRAKDSGRNRVCVW
ncbi:MAG: diguanylate cyclase [Rectinemataceae bacterium]